MEDTFRPWLEIWVHPRATIRRIANENPNRSLWALATIYGLGALLNNAQNLALGQQFSLFIILAAALILAPIWGYIFFAIWSGAVYWTGKLFKGTGTFQTVRAAYSWSCVPFTINIGLWILLAILFGQNLFMIQVANERLSQPLVYILFFILTARLILAIWSLVIYFNALAEVQNYSILKAIFNVVVAGLVLAGITWVFWNIAFNISLRQG